MESLIEIKEHLLVMLVRDFGYKTEPTYGHAPLRHWHAWHLATKDMSEIWIDGVVNRALCNAYQEGEKIPDPYRLELDGK